MKTYSSCRSLYFRRAAQFCLVTLFLVHILLAASVALADSIVTYNKPVTLNGLFGSLRPDSGWTASPLGAPGTINDGIFAAEGTLWTEGSIWWDAMAPGSENNSIVIDLQGTYHITGIITQADNNDNYRFQYFNPSTGTWAGYYWPGVALPGLVTRPSSDQVTPYPLSFDASMFRLLAFGGDRYYAISEFQAFGNPVVPEPSTFFLVGAGFAGLGLLARRFRKS